MSETASTERPAKAFSCIRCFERKVKCDKQNPCSNCLKSKVECVFRVPPAPRRKKKRPQEEALLARLRKCEELLKHKGIDIDSDHAPTNSTPVGTETHSENTPYDRESLISGTRELWQSTAARKDGQLIGEHGKHRFIENNLWTSVSSELQQSKDALGESSDEEDDASSPLEENTEFILGYTPSTNPVQHLHPHPDHVLVLWQIYLENINPMTKFVHQPSLHSTLVQAVTRLDAVPRGLEALMFAIYSAAIFSIEDDDCELKFGETRKVLLTRYRHATRKALARAKFMGTADLVVLQAFVIYLLTMREDYDSRTTWTLAGVASRVGQGMGLHRDGTSLGLSPFETEMRRRLWWQISIMDFRSAELSGSGRFGDFSLSDTQPPSNVNDADLHPDMTEAPVPQSGSTEMVACLLRCEFGHFWKEKLTKKSKTAFENIRLPSPWQTTMEERDAHIDELAQRIEEKFIRYCDPLVPIQFLCIIIGRSAINSMRLMAHHPRKNSNPEEISASERQLLWNASVKLLESDNLSHSSKHLRGFMWHITVYFAWQALIYILNELQTHTLGDDVDKAWAQVDQIFHHHTAFVADQKKPLHFAVGNLCLKAYSARECALREKTNGVFPKVVPEYISILRTQRKGSTDTSASIKPGAEISGGDAAQPGSELQALRWQDPMLERTAHHPYLREQNLKGQFPLPSLQPMQVPALPTQQFLFPADSTLEQDFSMPDLPMDWAQWDFYMQDLEHGQPR